MASLDTIGKDSTLSKEDVKFLETLVVILNDYGEYTKSTYLGKLIDTASKK